MNDHLIDTTPKLAECPRCGAYVLLATVSGLRTAVDPAPLDRNAFIGALLDGKRTYDLQRTAGKPSKLVDRFPGAPPFGTRETLAEHGCGAKAITANDHGNVWSIWHGDNLIDLGHGECNA